MKIKFLKDCYIEVCVGFDDNEEPLMEEERIVEGEIFEVEEIVHDIVETEFIQIQFGDGSVGFIDKKLFEIIEE